MGKKKALAMVRIDPDDRKKLKKAAVEFDKPMDEIISELVKNLEKPKKKGDEFRIGF